MNKKTIKIAEKQRKQPIKPRTQVRKLIKSPEKLRKLPRKPEIPPKKAQ